MNYGIAVAKLAKSLGSIKHFLVVTSVGADPTSSTLYLGTKGQVIALDGFLFVYQSIHLIPDWFLYFFLTNSLRKD